MDESNGALAALNSSLTRAFGETVELDRTILAGLYCATSRMGNECYGVCPNADLAGLGVRLAFYFQAALNACLVAISPEDSPSAAWGATLLTAAIIIPATLNKKTGELSLYHATLVLNFATLSSLASLAVAPLCPIWREKGLVVPLQQRLRDQLEGHDLGPESSPLFSTLPLQRPEFADELARASDDEDRSSQGSETDGASELEPVHAPEHAPSKQDVTYQRIVLSVALLAQVALQWSYALLLFTSPFYAEKSCTASTVVVLFGVPLKASEINANYFWVWVLWLVFNMGVTFSWGVFLVVSGAASSHQRHQGQFFGSSRLARFLRRVDPTGDRLRRAVMTSALIIACCFLGVAEAQQLSNCFVTASGENSDWSFGQVAALLLVLVPIWQIVVVANQRWFGKPKIVLNHSANSHQDFFTASPDRISRRLSESPSGSPHGHGIGLRPLTPTGQASPDAPGFPMPTVITRSSFLSPSTATLRSRS